MPRWPVAVVLALAAAQAHARASTAVVTERTASCLVVGVIDGDTLRMRCAGERIKVRIAGIDAPERDQPFGDHARRRLALLCFGRFADVSPVAIDRWGRTVARVACPGGDAAAALVRDGYAWHRFGSGALARLEAEARKARRGLWSEPGAVAPWRWRRR